MRPAAPELDGSLEFRGPLAGYGGELLISGSASVIGGYLLAELLKRTTVTVHALVAAADFADGYDLIRQRLHDNGQWDPAYASRIQPVPAELASPWLGLAPATFADLASRLDAIFHCATDDHLLKSYDDLVPVNVTGTGELLRLAAYGRGVRFHHLSIITVAPVDQAANLCVEAWPDPKTAACEPGTAGYIQARQTAELLVTEAAGRGLAASVYRTSTITGDSTGRYPERDVLVEYIRGTIRAGIHPRGRVGHWTPADYAARAIALLAAQEPGVYHVPACPVPLCWVWEHLRARGYPLRAGTDGEWRAAGLLAGTVLASLLDDGPDLPEHPPEVDCSRTLAAIGSALGAPAVSSGLVGRYLDDLRGRGLL